MLISDEDWVNVIDLDDWKLRPERPNNPKSVIGRHSRDHADKWPDTARDLLAVYPDNSEYNVAVLGGAEVPRSIIGQLPTNWTVLSFDAIGPYEFLCGLDVFVYFTHPSYIEAFGRVVFEAMAVGVPVILPQRFQRNFGDAALYCETGDVRKVVRALLLNKQRYSQQVSKGRRFVEERFGYVAHLRRIAPLVRAMQR